MSPRKQSPRLRPFATTAATTATSLTKAAALCLALALAALIDVVPFAAAFAADVTILIALDATPVGCAATVTCPTGVVAGAAETVGWAIVGAAAEVEAAAALSMTTSIPVRRVNTAPYNPARNSQYL
ncbi:hypothetical protein DFH07DRAFT_948785 [Mycena maculata]|uniref:Uncharacterized protein n=1 Tax=Mycena maculata TaxID=230809 RepID=A0AAD7KE64_9AGAR|nr:hypothetical protein DFH07DRAFT_948785 [Mycena maculata]